MILTLLVLAVSTTLNAIYFLRLVITLYSRQNVCRKEETETETRNSWNLRISILCFIGLNLILGLASQPIVQAIGDGLSMFG